MRRLFVTIIMGMVLLGFTKPAQAQSAVEVSDARVDYLFGSQITFSARIRSASPIQEALIFFQSEGEASTHLAPVSIAADGLATYQYAFQDGSLRPFAQVFFWYRVTLTTGEAYTSPQSVFDYIDNRFPWQTLEDELLHVHWYAGDLTFGQAAFDVAHVGLQKIHLLLPFARNPPMEIYIYASAAELQNALNLSGQAWAAGHASPDLGVVLVSLSPGPDQGIEMERQIPHEMTHVLLYLIAGPAYERLPVWLREGLASISELYPNADYRVALEAARQNGSLMHISELCNPFPQDASRAFLSYAESDSFTRYLLDTYGTSGLFNLMVAYSDGLDCDQGARRALGMSLLQLENRWRQSALGENVGEAALQNLLPYIIVLMLILLVPLWRVGAKVRKRANVNTKSG